MPRNNNEIQEDIQKCSKCQKKWINFYGNISGLYEKCDTCPTGVRANKDDSFEVREVSNRIRGWI